MISPHEFKVLWEIALYGPLASCEFESFGWNNYANTKWRPAGATLSSMRGRGLLVTTTDRSPHIWDLTEKGRAVVHGDRPD